MRMIEKTTESDHAIRLNCRLLGHKGCGVTELRTFGPKPLVVYTDNDSGLTPEDKAQIQKDNAGVIWLGKD